MVFLERIRLRDRSPAEPVGLTAGFLTGVWTAVQTWAVLAVPVVVVWFTASRTSAPWGQAIRVATNVWLAVHRVRVDVPGGRVVWAPVMVLVLLVWASWRAGRRLGSAIRASQAVPTHPHAGCRVVGPAVSGMALGYAGVMALAAVLSSWSGAQPSWWQASIAGIAMSGPSALLGALSPPDGGSVRLTTRAVVARGARLLRLPRRVEQAIWPAIRTAATVTGIAMLLVVVSMAVHGARIFEVHQALDPGLAGGVILTVAQLAMLPNAAGWGVAFLSGPGFVVGAGAPLTPVGSSVVLVPLIPLLGALPEPGPFFPGWMAVICVPVLSGARAGWRVVSAAPSRGLRALWGDAAMVITMATVLVIVLVWLSSGSFGPGRLVEVGPSVWRVGLAVAAELFVGAATAVWVAHRRWGKQRAARR
ncbi:MAG: cell division protein PerM [Actinomycetota bacterium]